MNWKNVGSKRIRCAYCWVHMPPPPPLLWKHNKINSNSIRLFKRTIARKIVLNSISCWFYSSFLFIVFPFSRTIFAPFCKRIFCWVFHACFFLLLLLLFCQNEKLLFYQRIKIIEKNQQKKNNATATHDKKKVRWYIAVVK